MMIFTFVTLMSGKRLTSAAYQTVFAFNTLKAHRTVSKKAPPPKPQPAAFALR